MAWNLWIINCLYNVHKEKICESQTFLWVTIAKVDVCSPDRTMHGLVRSWPGEDPEQFYFCLWLTKDFVIHKLCVHVVVVIHKKCCYSQIVRSSDSDPRLQRTESPLKTRRDYRTILWTQGKLQKVGIHLQKTAPNIEVFGKILPEKEPKLPKKAVFGHFFLVPIEQKIPYVRYFFRITLNLPYVRYFCVELRWIFFKIPYVRYFLMIFGRFFSAATTCRQISAVFSGGKHLPAIPNPLTYGFEKYRTYGNFSPIGWS